MNITYEQAEEIRDGFYSEYPVWRNCDEKGRLQFITAGELAADLLEARERIKDARNIIIMAGRYNTDCHCHSCESFRDKATGFMERTKEYAE